MRPGVPTPGFYLGISGAIPLTGRSKTAPTDGNRAV